MKTDQKIAGLGVLLAVLLAVFAGVWYVTRPAVSQGGKTVTVEVVHKDGSARTFTCQTDEEYLAGALVSEGLVQGREDVYGLYIETVDGEKAVFEDDGGYWAVYQSGEYAQLGISELPIHDGDSFSLVYTVYSAGE